MVAFLKHMYYNDSVYNLKFVQRTEGISPETRDLRRVFGE